MNVSFAKNFNESVGMPASSQGKNAADELAIALAGLKGNDTHEEIGRSGGETGWCEGQSHCVTRDACSKRDECYGCQNNRYAAVDDRDRGAREDTGEFMSARRRLRFRHRWKELLATFPSGDATPGQRIKPVTARRYRGWKSAVGATVPEPQPSRADIIRRYLLLRPCHGRRCA